MQIAYTIPETAAEGPGMRYAIWVQGCHHGCPGCFATELWPYDRGHEISVSDIIREIDDVADGISGITILGGEPLDQAEELSVIAAHVKKLGKNTIVFTGYQYEELTGEAARKLLSYTDILIDGKYEQEKQDFSRPLVGSSNQRIIFLGDGISQDEFWAYQNRIEVRTGKNGQLRFNGMGNINHLLKILKGLDGRL